MNENEQLSIDTSNIREWRSIVTLVVFVITNIIVLFPFHIPVYIPRAISNLFLDALSTIRVIPPRHDKQTKNGPSRPSSPALPGVSGRNDDSSIDGKPSRFIKVKFPMNFITAPIVADLFLLAILAIGREEVKGGTVGVNDIAPYDIMIFFLTLAYIAISVDASGLIRYLAFKVLQWGGEVGYRLFFYLYAFFFAVGGFIGNDPIILSGTAFLAYMTRVSSNIVHPRAWIHTQFAVANIASAILVSSNPTNLVLAGAFKIRFIVYTANMIVPVVVTAIVLFPFLLYVVFNNESLIPAKIEMHQLSEEAKARPPVNPNIPNARGNAAEQEEQAASNTEEGKLLSLEEILNPFLDQRGAAFGGIIMAATLITVLVLNASSKGAYPVYWVTLPASVVMFLWDLGSGWISREKTREIARKGRKEVQEARDNQARREAEEATQARYSQNAYEVGVTSESSEIKLQTLDPVEQVATPTLVVSEPDDIHSQPARQDPTNVPTDSSLEENEKSAIDLSMVNNTADARSKTSRTTSNQSAPLSEGMVAEHHPQESRASDVVGDDDDRRSGATVSPRQLTTLTSLSADAYRWCQETFPTTTAVITHLPFALVPFAFAMFILVQALVTKGWVPVFAWGWEHWVHKTGVVGAIGGMGFLSVILCNFAGTNIGTTILLSRVIQVWVEIHRQHPDMEYIDERTFWATVYSMALGVNYGAFSTAFSASLAGLLWRDILSRKHIRVRSLDFARVNLPIIAIAMTVGCAVLVGQVYITRNTSPYNTS